MGEFIQTVILSDVMVFSIMVAAGLAITAYAFTQREYAGYALGWMGAVFLIILFSTLSPAAAPDPGLGGGASAVQVSFLATFLPAVVGLMAGFGAIAVMSLSRVRSYRIVRALTVAFVLCMVLASGYLMLMSSFVVRLAIAVFVLGVGISILFYSIVARHQRSPDEVTDVQEAEPMATEAFADTPTMNRVQRIRQRFREGRQIRDY